MSFIDRFEGYGDLGYHGVRLPQFTIEKKYYEAAGVSEDVDNLTFLKNLCFSGFKKRGLDKSERHQEYIDRAKMELQILDELGFTDYVLLIWDIINFCHENSIPVGPGRGSAAGSLVLFLIGITNIDPIKYDLFFERFVSKSRAKKIIVDDIVYLDGGLLPDVDSDICYYKRHLVIDYVNKKFPGRTCKILTLNTLTGKLAIKETAKTVLEVSEDESKRLSDMVDKIHGNVMDLKDVAEESEDLKEWLAMPKEPYAFTTNEKAFKIARKLEGLPKNCGVHPSALLVSHSKLDESCPVQRTKEGALVSGFDMNWCAEIAVKVDLLGLRTVSVIDGVCKILKINIDDVDLDDPSIYLPLQDLKTPQGLFQIEADTQYRTCQKVKPESLMEVSDLMALARPGAMAYVEDYCRNKAGREVEPIHPELDKILSSTKNVALFQEQMMQIANKVFGFTLDEAEILRRIVGKKKVDEMPAWKDKIYAKAEEKGLSKYIADMYWKILDDSSSYSFNKSHSVSYATLATQTLYLKFNFCREFFLELLKMALKEPDYTAEISKISKELPSFGINLLPPDLLKSDMDFTLENGDIRYGLSAIKGVSEKSFQSLRDFRSEYPNKFELFHTAKEVGLNVGIVSALIQAGALASAGGDRCRMVLEAQTFNKLTDREKRFAFELGAEFDYDLFKMLKAIIAEERKDDKGKPMIKESRYATLKKNCDKYLKIYQQNAANQKLANWFFESKLLGYSYSSCLYDIMKDEMRNLIHAEEVENLEDREKLAVCGIVREVKKSKTKAGKSMLRMSVEDGNKSLMTLFIGERFDKWAEENSLPKEESLVVVFGSKSDDVIFVDGIKVLDNKIYIKLSDLK